MPSAPSSQIGWSLTICVVSVCLWGNPALAEEPSAPGAPPLTPSVFIGALEVIGVSDGVEHFGVYPTFGLGLLVPLWGPWSLIPSLGLEFCPELGNWGGTFVLTLDRLIHQGKRLIVTLDPYLALIHDAVPDGEGGFSHDVYAGAGLGPGFTSGKITLSPSLAVLVHLKTGDVVLSPTVLFSVPF